MRIYVCGPISGHADLNRAAFERARTLLLRIGHVPLVPHDFTRPDAEWQEAMRRSLETLAKADGIALLDGWRESHGACLEREIADRLGIPCAPLQHWLGDSPPRPAATTMRCPECGRVLPAPLFAWTPGRGRSMPPCRDCHRMGRRRAVG